MPVTNSSETVENTSLLGAILIGTNLPDSLSAASDGDIVFGLGGNDVLESHFNYTELHGDDGDDAVSTTLDYSGYDILWPDVVTSLYGGAGNDDLSVSIELTTNPDGFVTAHIYGDSGNDRIRSALLINSNDGGLAVARNIVDGGDGDDDIDLSAIIGDDSDISIASNTVLGGAGNDRINVVADTDFSANDTTSENTVYGGSGNDTITARAIAEPNNDGKGYNTLFGEDGSDVLTAFILADSNAGYGTAVNYLDGGRGNDILSAENETDGENAVTNLSSTLLGGYGSDRLDAVTLALADDGNCIAFHFLDGGRGDDVLTAKLDIGSYGAALTGDNQLFGRQGNDTLTAVLTVLDDEYSFRSVDVQNYLDGGNGRDKLHATINSASDGRSILVGGAGADNLTVVGGSSNILNGGTGNDVLRGSLGIDHFEFVADVNEGSDYVHGWDASLDTLNIVLHDGLISDTGAAGLADDVDAMSTISRSGADILLQFDDGTRVVFVGAAQGPVNSIADLFDVPASQLTSEDLLV